MLAEIYICHTCFGHKILRMETPGQAVYDANTNGTELRIIDCRSRMAAMGNVRAPLPWRPRDRTVSLPARLPAHPLPQAPVCG
jgi:hypothetical protein